jgi:chitinase
VTGYYPAYATDTMPIAAIPWGSLTHVIHFALVPNTDGTLADPDGLLGQSGALVGAGHQAGVKVLLGVGGDESVHAPEGFRASTQDALRGLFVQNIVEAMAAGGYDGLDVNWESLQFPEDTAPFQAFIRDLRQALDAHAPPTHYLLTYPAGTASDYTNFGNHGALVAPIQDLFDQINLQTYGMGGPFPGWVTWHNSPVEAGSCRFATTGGPPPSIDSTVHAFLSAGVLKSRLGIGMELVGVDWVGGSGTTTGGVTKPCQAWDYSAVKPDGSGQDIGAPSYSGGWNFVNVSDIIRSYTPANGFSAAVDKQAEVPYLSKDLPGSANDHFVSYEDTPSVQAKAAYLKAQGLGGTIVFEITEDYMAERPPGDPQHPLMSAIRDAFLR